MFAWNTRVACHDRDVVYSSWKLQCEVYVLQFYLNLFSVVLAQLRLTLRCRCIDASTFTPPHLSTFTSSHAHIRRSTSPHPHICTSISHLYIHTVAPSHLSCLSFFLSFFLSFLSFLSFISSLCIYIFARSHPQIDSPPPYILQIYIARAHPHCHSFTSTLSFSLSIHLFDSAGQDMSRSRANRRLVHMRPTLHLKGGVGANPVICQCSGGKPSGPINED